MNDAFDELKEILDNVHDYGHYLTALCPYHDESKPSFFVYRDTYKCLSCGVWGKTEELVRRLSKTRARYQGESNQQVFKNPFGLWLKEQSLPEICRTSWEYLTANPRRNEYLNNRGVGETYRKALGIGYKDGWYTIPIFNRKGSIIACVARAHPETDASMKYTQPHGTNPNILYAPNWKLYEDAKFVCLTYGIFDAITLAINNMMALSSISGKLTNPIGFEDIMKPIVVIPDLGEEKEANLLASRLGWRGHVFIPNYPENTKDINDIWTKNPTYFQEMKDELVRRFSY